MFVKEGTCLRDGAGILFAKRTKSVIYMFYIFLQCMIFRSVEHILSETNKICAVECYSCRSPASGGNIILLQYYFSL